MKSNHPHLKRHQGLLAAVAGLEVLEWGILVPGICPGVGCSGCVTWRGDLAFSVCIVPHLSLLL